MRKNLFKLLVFYLHFITLFNTMYYLTFYLMKSGKMYLLHNLFVLASNRHFTRSMMRVSRGMFYFSTCASEFQSILLHMACFFYLYTCILVDEYYCKKKVKMGCQTPWLCFEKKYAYTWVYVSYLHGTKWDGMNKNCKKNHRNGKSYHNNKKDFISRYF